MDDDPVRWIERWSWNGRRHVCDGLVAGPFPNQLAALEEIRRRRADDPDDRTLHFAVGRWRADPVGKVLGG